jgi:hypothetical protein
MVVRLVVVRWCGGVVVVEEELIFLNQVAGYVFRSRMCFFLLDGEGDCCVLIGQRRMVCCWCRTDEQEGGVGLALCNEVGQPGLVYI